MLGYANVNLSLTINMSVEIMFVEKG